MKKLFLLLAILALGSISAQGNGDYVSMTFVKTTPGEDYWTILNEKWKDLHQMRANEGTITGWDVWYRPNTGSESDWDMLIVTVAKSPDSLNANVGIAKMRPDYSEMDIEIFAEKNSGARTIVYDQFLVNKGLVFAGNEGETPVVPRVAVLNFMKVGYTDGYKYEIAENRLTSVESLGNRAGWGLLKRLDALGSDVYYDYMTVDFYENWDTWLSDREPSGSAAPISRQLRDIYSLRDHKQSVPVWLAISVRPEE
jgi:hypothetical protein|tara:strand:+ start:234 stop:995 length:762 start_codon:yes stop_codon:yes gene_type:complete